MKISRKTEDEASNIKRIKCHECEDTDEKMLSDIPSFLQNYLIEHSNIKTIAIIGHENSRESV